jgi:hypothetical protein
MPSPVAQIVALASSLRTAPTLKGFVKAQQVLLGRGKLSSDWSEAQIVIYPVSGKFTGPHNLETSGLDVTRSVAVRLRGKDFDQLGELEERFFQALWYRSAGGPSESPTPATPGPFWQAIAEDWVTDPDSSSAGEEVTVFITVVDSIDYVPPVLGRVDAAGLVPGSTTLSTSMGTGDQVAAVGGILGFPSSGLIQIDAEQIRYTGLTPSSFTGLIRGQNGTSAASHLLGATVTPVQHT